MKKYWVFVCITLIFMILLCKTKEHEKSAIIESTVINQQTIGVVSDLILPNTIRVLLKNGESIYHDSILEDLYSGTLYSYETSKGIVYVNELSVEEYLCGVIYSEMPSYFSDEALKAQIICARSYILSHSLDYAYPEYKANVDDSVFYQVYQYGPLDERAVRLVNETRGEVLSYNNGVIPAYFFSTSCGVTGDGAVWGSKVDFLNPVWLGNSGEINLDLSKEKDFNSFIKQKEGYFESNSPWFRWNVFFSEQQLREHLNQWFELELDKITSIIVKERTSYGLVTELTIRTKTQDYTIEGQNNIRKALGICEVACNDNIIRNLDLMPSAYFTVTKRENGYIFYGGGFGHGAGMSQYGAEAMAKQGYHYKEILKYFFPKAELMILKQVED